MMKKPLAVGLKVCEKAVVESKTGNISLVNCLPQTSRQEGISGEGPAAVRFCQCTDAKEVGELKLQSITGEDGRRRLFTNGSPNFPEPLQERWFLVPLGPVEFPVAGRYEIILLADGEWITRSVIDVAGEKP